MLVSKRDSSSCPGPPPGGDERHRGAPRAKGREGKMRGGGTPGVSQGLDLGPEFTSGTLLMKSNLILITVVKKSLNIKLFSPAIFVLLK